MPDLGKRDVRISIHALLAESDTTANEALQKVKISIHALLAESDRGPGGQNAVILDFYPRSPCGERLYCHCLAPPTPKNFYPRSPCGERLKDTTARQQITDISIHALLAESDGIGDLYPLGDGLFLSTLSLRRATRPYYPQSRPPLFLSTLSLRRATGGKIHNPGEILISIHALLAESDRGADTGIAARNPISIHALLAESDAYHFMPIIGTLHFYPRSPCGERPLKKYPVILGRGISIHALLAESDRTF